MPIGKLSKEDRRRLSDHFFAIVAKACVEHDCQPGEVLNRCRKSHGIKGISPARAEIVKEMRRTVSTYDSAKGHCRLWLHGDHEVWRDGRRMEDKGIPAGRSISFPFLARMIGCDHSALVLGQQKLKLQENDHA